MNDKDKRMQVKICGLTTIEAVDAVNKFGADMAGFVFVENSPRYVNMNKAVELMDALDPEIKKVGLFVNPTDDELNEVLSVLELDIIQLHGTEDRKRVGEIYDMTEIPIIKAIHISEEDDIFLAQQYDDVADYILFDAPQIGEQMGGNGQRFNWAWLQDMALEKPWILAGGLNPQNIFNAIRMTGAQIVDVSSGVEATKGIKDTDKIADFINEAHRAAYDA